MSNRNQKPGAAEVARIIAYLKANGVPAADAAQFIRTTRTRGNNEKQLTEWLATRPKK